MRARVLCGTVAELCFKATGSYGENITMESRYRCFFLSCETNRNFEFFIYTLKCKNISFTAEEVM
jgi:hypothetical protein